MQCELGRVPIRKRGKKKKQCSKADKSTLLAVKVIQIENTHFLVFLAGVGAERTGR